MRKREILRFGTVAFIVVLALFTTMANAQSAYEVWDCGDFNLRDIRTSRLFNSILSGLR